MGCTIEDRKLPESPLKEIYNPIDSTTGGGGGGGGSTPTSSIKVQVLGVGDFNMERAFPDPVLVRQGSSTFTMFLTLMNNTTGDQYFVTFDLNLPGISTGVVYGKTKMTSLQVGYILDDSAVHGDSDLSFLEFATVSFMEVNQNRVRGRINLDGTSYSGDPLTHRIDFDIQPLVGEALTNF